MPDIRINPGNSALLIQDMQNDIVKSDRPVVPMGSALLIANAKSSWSELGRWPCR